MSARSAMKMYLTMFVTMLVVVIFIYYLIIATVSQLQDTSHPLQNEVIITTHPDIDGISAIMCCLVKYEERYIEEWIEYHLLLGFDKIYIYDNSKEGTLIQYFHHKIQNNHAFTFDYHKINITHRPGRIQQLKAYNKCWKHHWNDSTQRGIKWVALVDIDEFIVLKQDDNIKSFLYKYKHNLNSLALARFQFGSNGHLHFSKHGEGVLDRFTKREINASWGVKTIARLDYLDSVINPHFVRMRHGYGTVFVGGDERMIKHSRSERARDIFWGNRYVPGLLNCKVACVYHYYLKSMEYWNTKIEKGKAYTIHFKNTIQEWRDKNEEYNQVNDTFARDWDKNEEYNQVNDTFARDW
eukprot:721579_1